MSKFCENCGKELKQSSTFCSECGTPITKDVKTNQLTEKKNNGISVSGFVCALIGFITCGLTSLIGLVLSIIGLIKSKKQGKTDVLAILGIIISSIIVGLWILIISNIILTSRTVVVPDFSTMTYKEALNYCEESILNCTFSIKQYDTIPEGAFISQSVEAGKEINEYKIVDIVYNADKETIVEEETAEESKITQTTKTINNKALKKIKNQTLRENFIKACEQIKMDASKIKNVEKVNDWNSGPRYTFIYKNTSFMLYAYDDGGVSSITIANKNLDKIYLEGYEPYNVNDYLLDAGRIGDLQVAAEKSIKNALNHPDTADFHWYTTGSYCKIKDIYVVSGKFEAKNSFGVKKESSFYIEEQIIDENYTVVYMTIDKEKYIGTESKIEKIERQAIPEASTSENQDSKIITLKEGQKGAYGREDTFDGEKYIRYYIPAGKYKVEAKTKNAQFFIESVAIYKENGYDTSTEIRNVKLSKVGDKETIEITSDQCIMLVMYTKIQLTKID